MYCPNCGNKRSASQRFCRVCGFGLEKVAESLAEQLPAQADRTLLERKKRLERLGVAALSIFGLSIIGFFSYSVFSKLMLTQGSLVAGLIVLAGLLVIGCALASVILFAKANELKEASTKRLAEQPLEPGHADTTSKLLDIHREPVFSVADRTTDLLSVKRVKDGASDE